MVYVNYICLFKKMVQMFVLLLIIISVYCISEYSNYLMWPILCLYEADLYIIEYVYEFINL